MSAAALMYEDVVVRIREAWADVLGSDSAEEIPLDVNFLEFGGNSLLLVMLWEELQPIAARPMKLSELFHHGTVQAQAELVAGEPDAAASAGPPAPAKQVEPVELVEPVGPRSVLAQRRAAATSGGAG